mgnify:CR=1 FL=1
MDYESEVRIAEICRNHNTNISINGKQNMINWESIVLEQRQ